MVSTFNEDVFLDLSLESQDKVEQIYCIASMLHRYNQPPLSAKDFDSLYDKSINELEEISGYVKRALEFHAHEGE